MTRTVRQPGALALDGKQPGATFCSVKQKFDTRTTPYRTQLQPASTWPNAGVPLPPPPAAPLEYAGSKGLRNGVPQGKDTPVPPMAGGRRPRRGMST